MRTALILDDDKDTLEVLQLALGMEGFEVDVSDHPDKALSKMESGSHCVLFLDFFIPSMDVQEFLQKVRTSKPKMPVVLMSGHADISIKARELCVNGILAKPFNIDQLMDVVREHCPV